MVIFEQISQCVERIKKCNDEKIRLPESVGKVLEEKINVVQQMVEDAQRSVKLSDLLNSFQEVTVCVEQYNEKKAALVEEVRMLQTQLVECPLCGTELNEVSKAKLLS